MGRIAGVEVSEMTPKQLEDARAHVLAIKSRFGGVRPEGEKPWVGKQKPQGRVFNTGEVRDAVEALGGGFSIK